ncbi:hypothetical protein K438DRAFT_2025362 [Mycena galopus ATCC 62051]|nr:hypothetical protein K438DRAFT_2025362 [Mycena galopus ATCC 62051]
MHGAVVGAQFLPGGDARGVQALKRVFVAASVNQNSSILIPTVSVEDLVLPAGTRLAVSDWRNDAAKVFIHTGQDPSLVISDLSVQQLRMRPSFLIVNSLDAADLAVKSVISRYITRDIKLAVPPGNLSYILDAVAQFNYFLARHNGSDPLEMRNEVRMAMYSLRGEYGHRMPNLDIGNVVIDGEARSLHNSDDKYGFAIFNHSQHDLFPYLIYFDPGTYSIDVRVVVPESPTMAPPLPRMPGDGPKRLTIGYGADGGYAFQFFVPEGITSDTGFLKLIRVHEVPGLEVH